MGEEFCFGLPIVGVLAVLFEFFDGVDLITQECSAFEFEGDGCFLHFGAHFAEHDGALGLEEAVEAFDVGAVGGLGDAVGAGCGALADGVEEAGAEILVLGVVRSNVEVAGAKFESALEELDGIAEGTDVGEWAEDLGGFEFRFVGIAGDEDAGEIIAGGDDKIGEGLVIELHGVETWSGVFDEAVFGEECFPFGFAFDAIEIVDELEHGLFFGA